MIKSIIILIILAAISFWGGIKTKRYIYRKKIEKIFYDFEENNYKVVENLPVFLSSFNSFSNDEISFYSEMLKKVCDSALFTNMPTAEQMMRNKGDFTDSDLRKYFSALQYILYCDRKAYGCPESEIEKYKTEYQGV